MKMEYHRWWSTFTLTTLLSCAGWLLVKWIKWRNKIFYLHHRSTLLIFIGTAPACYFVFLKLSERKLVLEALLFLSWVLLSIFVPETSICICTIDGLNSTVRLSLTWCLDTSLDNFAVYFCLAVVLCTKENIFFQTWW